MMEKLTAIDSSFFDFFLGFSWIVVVDGDESLSRGLLLLIFFFADFGVFSFDSFIVTGAGEETLVSTSTSESEEEESDTQANIFL